MSPTWYVFVLGPLSERALGRSPYFSRPNRSFIDTFNGRTETKSRAVVLSANVAVRSFAPTFMLIFMSCVCSFFRAQHRSCQPRLRALQCPEMLRAIADKDVFSRRHSQSRTKRIGVSSVCPRFPVPDFPDFP